MTREQVTAIYRLLVLVGLLMVLVVFVRACFSPPPPPKPQVAPEEQPYRYEEVGPDRY